MNPMQYIRKGFQTYIGGGDSSQYQDPNAEIRYNYQQQKKALKAREQHLEQLKAENSYLQNQKLDLDRRIKETEEEVATVLQDLSATTVDAPTEGSMTRDHAAQEFYSLTRNIFHVVHDIFQTLHPHLPKTSITGKDILAGVAQNFLEILKDDEAPWLINRLPLPCSPLMLLIPIIHRALFRAILTSVFMPFVPGELDPTTETFLSHMYTRLAQTETQDRRSRWRALTYRHVSQDRPADICISYADQFMQQLHALFLSTTDHNSLPDEDLIRTKVTTLFEQAISLRDRSMKECTDIDVSVVLPPHGSFKEYMKPLLPQNKNRPQWAIFALSWVIQFSTSRGIGQQPRYINTVWSQVVTEISKLPSTMQDLDKLAP
ncbi:hypothetical protein FRC17_003889 [Serendipita sp. 399]|nr:hypothetical protein FRC17_003889 [Serendipita sp. 399]